MEYYLGTQSEHCVPGGLWVDRVSDEDRQTDVGEGFTKRRLGVDIGLTIRTSISAGHKESANIG